VLVLDAIIVPTARAAATEFAGSLADDLGASLLIIRGESIAGGRNSGLDTARALGWRNVMFLDDDIRVLPSQVTEAVSLLRNRQAAAFRSVDFPDNSVVRHAARAAGAQTPVLPGGGAMLVRMSALPARLRFIDVYNEDWLFMHDLDVADAGEVLQLPYNPFTPGRAAREEFGDLIAEAVRDREVSCEESFWEAAIAERRRLLDGLGRLLNGAAAASVAEAGDALSEVTPRRAASFCAWWRGADARQV
jgi:hypothetical protein